MSEVLSRSATSHLRPLELRGMTATQEELTAFFQDYSRRRHITEVDFSGIECWGASWSAVLESWRTSGLSEAQIVSPERLRGLGHQ